MERSAIRGKVAAHCDHCVSSAKSAPDSAALHPGYSLLFNNLQLKPVFRKGSNGLHVSDAQS
jgi:hypothetical protein